MDLEVDHRWHDASGKIVDSHESEKIPGSGPGPHASDEVALKPTFSIFQAKQRRSPAFYLSIGLAAGVALAAIAAAVAGSMAMQRQSRLKACIQSKDFLTTGLNHSCAPSLPSSNTSNKTNTTAPSIHNIKPTSECRSLPSPFTSATGSPFTLECGIDLTETEDFGARDLVGVYVYTFTDCVDACAIYNDGGSTGGHGNSTCYAVSFNFALGADEGNCWLKGHQRIPFHSNETVDSAIFEVS